MTSEPTDTLCDVIDEQVRRHRAMAELMTLGSAVIMFVAFKVFTFLAVAVIAALVALGLVTDPPHVWLISRGIGVICTVILWVKPERKALSNAEFRRQNDPNVLGAATSGTAKWNATRLVMTCLFFGPRLLRQSRERRAAARRIEAADYEHMAAILLLLYNAGHRVSYADIIAVRPGVDPTAEVLALRDMDAIKFLSSEPEGLTLNSELRSKLATRLSA